MRGKIKKNSIGVILFLLRVFIVEILVGLVVRVEKMIKEEIFILIILGK